MQTGNEIREQLVNQKLMGFFLPIFSLCLLMSMSMSLTWMQLFNKCALVEHVCILFMSQRVKCMKVELRTRLSFSVYKKIAIFHLCIYCYMKHLKSCI